MNVLYCFLSMWKWATQNVNCSVMDYPLYKTIHRRIESRILVMEHLIKLTILLFIRSLRTNNKIDSCPHTHIKMMIIIIIKIVAVFFSPLHFYFYALNKKVFIVKIFSVAFFLLLFYEYLITKIKYLERKINVKTESLTI